MQTVVRTELWMVDCWVVSSVPCLVGQWVVQRAALTVARTVLKTVAVTVGSMAHSTAAPKVSLWADLLAELWECSLEKK